MTAAELAARQAAAAALLAGFERADADYLGQRGPAPEYTRWAYRLAAELGVVLGNLDTTAMISRADLGTIQDALGTAAGCLRGRARDTSCYECAHAAGWLCGEHDSDLDRAAEYDALAAQLTRPGGA